MTGPTILVVLAVVASPALAYLVYRLARELGFLDPPVSKEHEHRRAILAALYALLLFLPVFLFGWERRWPRGWILFGVFCGLALVFFAAAGAVSARTLWKLRHPPSLDAGLEPSGAAEGVELPAEGAPGDPPEEPR